MSSVSKKQVGEALPQGMQEHTYPIMYEIEDAHWWYAGRRRIIKSFLGRVCRNFQTPPRILDVGCGTGANLELLAEFGETEGVDISQEALAFCRERGFGNVRHGAAEKLPHADNTFDVVTALDVIEHLDDDLASLQEMRRVLRPGGRVLLFVPAFMFLWGVQDDVSNHRRRYKLKELETVVERAGFEVERATYANITFFAPILLVRTFMRLARIRPSSGDFKINVPAFNGVLGRVFGAERFWLSRLSFPFGVSALCVARRKD
ncbi:MAG TPA: class I SAM-dependent methyltransferase [Pyrinomonadaceae bacterium]|nr:class I SAM-dependent methyltransferase [Pyrinomonadaceae bacterium]